MATKLAARPVRRATRKVYAPTSGGVGMMPGSLLSVTLEEGEDVLWHWTHHQDGQRAVTGYTIVSKSVRSLLDHLPQ